VETIAQLSADRIGKGDESDLRIKGGIQAHAIRRVGERKSLGCMDLTNKPAGRAFREAEPYRTHQRRLSIPSGFQESFAHSVCDTAACMMSYRRAGRKSVLMLMWQAKAERTRPHTEVRYNWYIRLRRAAERCVNLKPCVIASKRATP
jgi:hypothetical protein